MFALIAQASINDNKIDALNNTVKNERVEKQKINDERLKLEHHTLTTAQQKAEVERQKAELEKQNQEKDAEIQRLNGELQAKIEARKKSIAAKTADAITPRAAALSPNVVAGCGDNSLAAFIYDHESDCNLTARNSIGCVGIGQNCPDKNGHYWLIAACPDWATNYDCQNAAFTNYAMQRYGGWEGAYQFWLANRWW